MEFKKFAEEVKKGLEVLIKDKISDGKVILRKVRKNNNVKMVAVSIVKEGEKAMPTIYLKEYYKRYNDGASIEVLCQEIYEVYEQGIAHFNKYIDVEKLLNYEMVKDHIYYKLINYEKNRIMLKEHPHIRFLDMAIVFYVMVNSYEDGQATALIHNVHLINWNVTSEDIKELAFENTWREQKPVIRKMEDIVSELIMEDIIDDDDILEEEICYGGYTYSEIRDKVREQIDNAREFEDMRMFVLTNESRINGATCITYPGILEKFGNKLNDDFYVIPSSIHEVILVPKAQWKKERFDDMVKDVNSTELDPVEILSDHAYLYNRKTGMLEY